MHEREPSGPIVQSRRKTIAEGTYPLIPTLTVILDVVRGSGEFEVEAKKKGQRTSCGRAGRKSARLCTCSNRRAGPGSRKQKSNQQRTFHLDSPPVLYIVPVPRPRPRRIRPPLLLPYPTRTCSPASPRRPRWPRTRPVAVQTPARSRTPSAH